MTDDPAARQLVETLNVYIRGSNWEIVGEPIAFGDDQEVIGYPIKRRGGETAPAALTFAFPGHEGRSCLQVRHGNAEEQRTTVFLLGEASDHPVATARHLENMLEGIQFGSIS